MGQNSSNFAELAALEDNQIADIRKRLEASPFFSELESFAATLDGPLLLPAEDGILYGQARNRAFNIDQRGYPLIIVRVITNSDVIKCVEFVRKYSDSIDLCVASGCHSSKCMVTGSFVIDLHFLNKVKVNAEDHTVMVEAGAYLQDVDVVLAQYGLCIPLGSYPLVGIGGSTMAGGYGWLSRQFGLSVDSLLEVEIVLADGTITIANDKNNPDLIWAVRGGGGNFGVITKFIFRAYKLPKYCIGGTVQYLTPLENSAKVVAKNYDALIQTLSEQFGSTLCLQAGTSYVKTAWSYIGDSSAPQDVEELKRAITLGGWLTVENNIRRMSYHHELQKINKQFSSSGFIYQSVLSIGSHNKPLPDAFFDQLVAFTTQIPVNTIATASVQFIALGGSTVTSDNGIKTCVSPAVRSSRYFALIEAYWKPECGEKGKNDAKQWAKKAYCILSQYRSGYVSHAPDEVTSDKDIERISSRSEKSGNVFESVMDSLNNQLEEQSRSTLFAEVEKINRRLTVIKTQYDPTNLFHNNSNIQPSMPFCSNSTVSADSREET